MNKIFKISDFELNSFKGVAAKESPEGDIFLIPSGAVFPERLKREKFKRVKLESASKHLRSGDVLFNTGGVGTLGRCGYFDETIESTCVPDSFVLVLRFLKPNILPKYIFYFFQSAKVKAKIIQKNLRDNWYHLYQTEGCTISRDICPS